VLQETNYFKWCASAPTTGVAVAVLRSAEMWISSVPKHAWQECQQQQRELNVAKLQLPAACFLWAAAGCSCLLAAGGC